MSLPVLHPQAFSRFAIPADPAWIRSMVPEGVAGAYLLLREGRPFYVGRSDSCLAGRLTRHELLGQASHLLWEVCRDPVRAYHCEAYLYDSSRHTPGFLNRVHPARPAGYEGGCPFCSIEAEHIQSLIKRWRAPMANRQNTGAEKKLAQAVPTAA
jgi:hypothetical protein